MLIWWTWAFIRTHTDLGHSGDTVCYYNGHLAEDHDWSRQNIGTVTLCDNGGNYQTPGLPVNCLNVSHQYSLGWPCVVVISSCSRVSQWQTCAKVRLWRRRSTVTTCGIAPRLIQLKTTRSTCITETSVTAVWFKQTEFDGSGWSFTIVFITGCSWWYISAYSTSQHLGVVHH